MPAVTSTEFEKSGNSRLIRVTKDAYETVMKEAVRRGLTIGNAATTLILEWAAFKVQPRLEAAQQQPAAHLAQQQPAAHLAQPHPWKCTHCGQVVLGVPGKQGHINSTGHDHFELADASAHLAQEKPKPKKKEPDYLGIVLKGKIKTAEDIEKLYDENGHRRA